MNIYLTIKNLIATLVLGGLVFLPLFGVSANSLEILNIQVIIEGNNAIVNWETNSYSTGWVDFGLTQDYDFRLADAGVSNFYHSVRLQNLDEKKIYHFRITAKTPFEQTSTFDGVFKTKEANDDSAPKITDVGAYYVTGSQAVIRWTTDEPASSTVNHGLTTKYGSRAGSSSRTTQHEVILKNLKIATPYHFKVESKDQDGNVSTYTDQTFRTSLTGEGDNLILAITKIRPITANDPAIGVTSAVITWQTNKLADGVVRYGKTQGLGKSVRENDPRQFFHSRSLENLEPGTLYYFQVISKDVFGKTATSQIMSFRTLTSMSNTPTSAPAPTGPVILGSSNASVNQTQLSCNEVDSNVHRGFYGYFYNHVKLPTFYSQRVTDLGTIQNASGWYASSHHVLSRIDPVLNFEEKFFPVHTGLKNDPHYFTVYWKSLMYVPEDNTYQIGAASGDDSWVFIDGQMLINLRGMHGRESSYQKVVLTKGYHVMQIFYADRAKYGATMVLKPDSRIIFYALPEGCDVNAIVSRQSTFVHNTAPVVLGVGLSDVTQPSASDTPGSATRPASPYTPASALYRVVGSPDIYAIVNGKKHYISGPTSFAEYGYNWNHVKVVSAELLASIPDARLLRLPQDSTVYYLYQRPLHQWLKIAIPSPTVFVSYPQNYWGDIVVVNRYDLEAYPDVKFVRTSESPEVFLLSQETIYPFLSESAFASYGHNVSEVARISIEHINAYQRGESIDVKSAF